MRDFVQRISRGRFAALAIAACFLAVALYHGLRATRDLAWHPGNDAYRDIALAQIILDGDYPADGLAAGEWLWYNPLTGALVAAAARIAEMPPPLADIRMGPYINLLVPASFFLLVWYLADIWVALAALVSFIFILPQDRPSFVTAGYSPWLLAPHLTQALFYGTLLMWARYLKSANGWTAAGAGLLLGITFLGHTAPAVLLGTIMVATGLWRPHASPAHWRHLTVALLVAFVTSLPFTISILFRYRLNIVHSTPTEWIWEGAALENLPSTVAGLIRWQTAVMLVGFGFVAFGNTPRHIKSIAVAWPAAAFLFLAYSYLAQWAARHGIGLRQINPGYHYVLYVIAAGHFYFGAGVVALTDLASRLSPLASRLSPLACRVVFRWRAGFPGTLRPVLVVLAVAVLFAAHYRDFRVWHGFTRDHTVALRRLEHTDHFAPYYWIAENVDRGAVFLCDDRPGLFCVAPAGARVVAGDPYFWNLYVPLEPRAVAREQLWAALRDRDSEEFAAVAAAFGVTHVLAEGEQRDWVAQSGVLALEMVFSSKSFSIYAFRPLTPATGEPPES